jgi:uncharacterized integral membrane protein
MSQTSSSDPNADNRGQKLFIVILDVAVLLVIFSCVNTDLVGVTLWPWGPVRLPLFLIAAGGFAAGVLTTVLLYRISRHATTPTSWILIVLFCTAVMGVAAARSGEIKFWQAMMVILIGGPALIATARAIELIGEGETIEMQSQWGGLGGVLGGWRLSPVTSLVLLAFAFAGGAIGVAIQSKQPDGSEARPASEKSITAHDQATDQKTVEKPGAAPIATPEKNTKPMRHGE